MKKLFSKLMLVAMAAMTFTACEDVPEPYPVPQPTPEEEITYKGSGTLESPYTCDDVIKYVQSLDGEESENEVYVKGIVTEVTDGFSNNTYGNGTFKISDDGTPTNEFVAWRVLYLGNKKYTKGEDVKIGDEVILYGKVVNYNGKTPETVQGKAFLYSLNGVTEGGGGNDQPQGEAKGDGTLENPFNATAATIEAKKLASGAVSDKAYYIKGKVASIANDKNGNAQNFDFGTYGNASFYISDDGSSTDQFYCYRVLYLGNKKWTQGAGDVLKIGDEVIVCAKLTMYNTTPETAQNEGFLYSLNGKTEGGGQQQETKVVGSIDQPVTTTDAVKVIEKLSDGATTEEYYYVKGIVTKITTAAEDIGPNSSSGKKYKDINYYIADEQGSNNQIQVYRGRNLNNTDFTSADQLKVGDEVIVYGQLMKYKNDSGIIPEMAQGNYLVKRNGETSGNDENPQGGDNQGGTLEGNVLTVKAAEFGFANEKEATTSTLVDGTKVTFSKADGTSTPKYYAGDYASVRVYANNTVTIEGSKKITSIVITTTAPGSGKKYNGGEEIYAQGASKVDGVKGSDTNVTFSGLNDQKVTIVNVKDGSNTQLRISKMVITFAE